MEGDPRHEREPHVAGRGARRGRVFRSPDGERDGDGGGGGGGGGGSMARLELLEQWLHDGERQEKGGEEMDKERDWWRLEMV